MKFKDYEYVKPNIDEIKKEITELLQEFKQAKDVAIQNKVIEEINRLRNRVETAFSLASTRHTLNTNDKFYEEQNNLVDEISPIYTGLITDYYKALLSSTFISELKQEWGEMLFKVAEVAIKSFDEKIIEDLQAENKLSSQYSKLISSAKIKFKGKIHNLAQLGKYMRSPSRRTRRAANDAYYGFFADHVETLDRIYDEMVHVRDRMAKKMGFKNFVELAYLRLGRTDYDASMVANYRKQIQDDLVPVAQELFARQAKRIGIKKPEYYDYGLEFTSGNATPKGDKDWMLEHAQEMYDELSKETSTFFRFMRESELLDLETRPHKVSGGYCTYFAEYQSPFIFSNFNGTRGDVEVLTHEMGHAFQIYSSRNYKVPEYMMPTLETCEIHSMSMEFFTWPWMKKFFEEDELKFKYSHLSGAITFIPYGVSVDEFQHFVYENPNATPLERRQKWTEIEHAYQPHLKYSNNEFLQNGGYWMRQGHIFSSPFYYIDYTLAQVIAFQFLNLMNEDHKAAWEKYVKVCRLGGSMSFLSVLKEAGLENPFQTGTVKKTVEPLTRLLNTFDDTNL